MEKTTVQKKQRKILAERRAIKRRNLAFSKMSLAEKRITLAKDGIKQIANKKIIPTFGTWLSTGKLPHQLADRIHENDQELHVTLAAVDTCKGCALGSIFKCAVDRANSIKTEQFLGYGDTVDIEEDSLFSYLKKYFTELQMELIELAFEQEDGWFASGCSGDFSRSMGLTADNQRTKAILFCKKRDSAATRMTKILKNIIQNNGLFKP